MWASVVTKITTIDDPLPNHQTFAALLTTFDSTHSKHDFRDGSLDGLHASMWSLFSSFPLCVDILFSPICWEASVTWDSMLQGLDRTLGLTTAVPAISILDLHLCLCRQRWVYQSWRSTWDKVLNMRVVVLFLLALHTFSVP